MKECNGPYLVIKPVVLLAAEYLQKCEEIGIEASVEGCKLYCQKNNYRLKWLVFWQVKKWWKPWTWIK